MKSIFLAAAACVLLSGPALAMTETECTTMWKAADGNSDGKLIGPEGDRFLAMMRIGNQAADADGTITEERFLESCKGDIFKVAASETGAPLPGANSFTENQAKDRVVAHGWAVPAFMTMDADGIWRGTSMTDGKSTSVAVDYKGNVVTQ